MLQFNNTYFTTRRCIYGPGGLFLLRHLCSLEEHKGRRYLPQARAGRHESVRKSNLNLQIQGSRSRCLVPPVFCEASTLFSPAFPSSCLPGPLYDSGCSAPQLDSWALRMPDGSQQTGLCAPSLVRSHDLEKTEALIFRSSSSQLSFYADLQWNSIIITIFLRLWSVKSSNYETSAKLRSKYNLENLHLMGLWD